MAAELPEQATEYISYWDGVEDTVNAERNERDHLWFTKLTSCLAYLNVFLSFLCFLFFHMLTFIYFFIY